MTRKQLEKNLQRFNKEELIEIILETHDGFNDLLESLKP